MQILGKIPPHRLRLYLQVVLFPWAIWALCRYAVSPLRRSRRLAGRSGRALAAATQVSLYAVAGLPATILLLGEVVISANEWVLGEQSDFRLQSDYDAGFTDRSQVLALAGPPTPAPRPARNDDREELYRYLVELYAPVLVQKIANQPEWDLPLFVDFDGNDDPRDNVENEPGRRPHRAGLYGEVTAITADSIYLTYSAYHVKDYDHPVREALSRWTYHDNDNEGFHIRVDRRDGAVAEIETWFHNRFLLFNHTGVSTGTEPVHGRIHLEGRTHPIIYMQPQGHGVRCAQLVDLPNLEKNLKVLRWRGERPAVAVEANRAVQLDATYELENFDTWYRYAQGPFGTKGVGEGMFEETIPLGEWPDGTKIELGRFLAGRDYMVGGWSRPKPMWSWDDGWDDVPIVFWHFLPHLSFASHGGNELSGVYTYNRPLEKTFGARAREVVQYLDPENARRGGEKWTNFQEAHAGTLGRSQYWQAFQKQLRTYVNYLFHALG